MALKETPEWNDYLARCRQNELKPSLIDFVRWTAQRENGLKKWETTPVNENLVLVSPNS